jgi:hypothetical protein
VELITPSVSQAASDDHAARRRAAEAMRREISQAGAVLTGLHTLMLEMTNPATRTLPDATDWALGASAPVAARRAITLTASDPLTQVPACPGPAGLSLVLALVFVEACLESPRRSTCQVTPLPESRCGVDIAWAADPAGPDGRTQAAVAALASLLRGSGDVLSRLDHQQRHVIVELRTSGRGGPGAASFTGRTFGA